MLTRRRFLGTGAAAAVGLNLPRHRVANDGITQVLAYRQQLSPDVVQTSFVQFTIPDHPGSSIAIESICFFDTAGTATVQTGDALRAAVFRAGPTVTTIFTSGSVYAHAGWLATGVPASTTFVLNPGSDPWLSFSPPIRLSPNDAPVTILFRNDTASRCPQNMLAIVVGFEYWSNDITRQYPAPQHLAGAKS